MKISTSIEYGYVKLGDKKTVEVFKKAGFDCLDFSFNPLKHSDLKNEETWLESFKELKEYADSQNITFNQAHAPFPSSLNTEEETEERIQNIIASIKYASILGAKIIVVHPRMDLIYMENRKELKKINYEFYSRLLPYCEKYNVKVAIENMWQKPFGINKIMPSVCADPEEFVDYVDMMNSPYIVACLDIGHCALTGINPVYAIKTLGKDRLQSLHVHDVNYFDDNHNLPGIEKLNYYEIISALKEIGYSGEFTLEADGWLKKFSHENDADFLETAIKFMADRTRHLAKFF